MSDPVKLTEEQFDVLVRYVTAIADRNNHSGDSNIYRMRQRACAEARDLAREAFGLGGGDD